MISNFILGMAVLLAWEWVMIEYSWKVQKFRFEHGLERTKFWKPSTWQLPDGKKE